MLLFLFKYRLTIVLSDGSVTKVGSNDCHKLKSMAGRLFHSPTVESVIVKERFGKAYLFLSKSNPMVNFSVPSPT